MLTEFTFALSCEFFGDKEVLESVQKRAVAMVTYLPREMTYPEKLAALGLTTLQCTGGQDCVGGHDRDIPCVDRC